MVRCIFAAKNACENAALNRTFKCSPKTQNKTILKLTLKRNRAFLKLCTKWKFKVNSTAITSSEFKAVFNLEQELIEGHLHYSL
jgi:ribosome-associated toxin RatA of RatAB toxin-antitoxin module